jgi:hypothetical protein
MPDISKPPPLDPEPSFDPWIEAVERERRGNNLLQKIRKQIKLAP